MKGMMRNEDESGSESSQGPDVLADADNIDASSDISDEGPAASLAAAPLPPADPDFAVQVHDDISHQAKDKEANGRNKKTKSSEVSAPTKNYNTPQRQAGKIGRRHRKGRLLMRPAIVKETKDKSTNLPRDHYETVLHRRAVRKPPSDVHSESSDPQFNENGDEIFGDTSLGMKLNVMGGKVIVQSLNPLSDGRASPAQLSGVIQRGDVLLQINGVSLVNLPIDRLMKGLSPLSTPDERNGAYQRTLFLRLASGEGLNLLRQAKGNRNDESGLKMEGKPGPVTPPLDPAADMFSLFPMVDNSGLRVENDDPIQETSDAIEKDGGKDEDKEDESETPASSASLAKTPGSLDEIIGEKLAEERSIERKKAISEFFSREGGIFFSLQYLEPGFMDAASHTTDNDPFAGLTPAEMIDIGTKALKGAKALSAIIERVDKGSDRRSFQSLSATLSLYSRASTRRRYVLDGRAMPVNFDKVQEAALTEEEDGDDEKEEEENNSERNSDEGEQLDGDELLLRLAATDEIWRKQVLDFLDHVIEQALEEASDESTQHDGNVDLSNELGSFLFGTDMTKVLNRKRKSHVLPPPEITSLLFDLTTKISSTVPDRIKAEGDPITVRSSLVPFIGMKRPAADSNVMLANHFLLNQVLPLWLKSFRPLALDQRRIMWPPESPSLESTTGSTLSGDDSITIGSITTRNTGAGSRTKKNLREQIEDNELDPESRAETCFLTTYYFTQHLLPRLLPGGGATKPNSDSETLEELLDFVSQFGSYLKLHTCLAYAAVLKSSKLIDSLLEVAKFDPRHREVMKQTSRPSALIIYDSTMLSAVMQRLRDIRAAKPERRRATINLCYQAYPDLRPWQVKKECHGSLKQDMVSAADTELSDLYYTYLDLLLHPTDGHDGARHDPALVKEFCTLSVKGISTDRSRRNNFLRVASKTSSDHLAYSRHLPMLLKLSMEAAEFDLALDLAAEILDSNTNLNSEKSLRVMISYVTNIGRQSVDGFLEDKERGTRVLKRVLRLYNRLSTLGTDAAKSAVNIPIELITLLEHAESVPNPSMDGVIELASFLAEEARPDDILEALVRWCAPDNINSRLYPVYQIILKGGARDDSLIELSISLYRVIQAHSRFEESVGMLRPPDSRELRKENVNISDESLWTQLSHGALYLDK